MSNGPRDHSSSWFGRSNVGSLRCSQARRRSMMNTAAFLHGNSQVSAPLSFILSACRSRLPFAWQIKERGRRSSLGVNGDGRAPAGSFGARIQLGLLVGLLTPGDAAPLRAIKELRDLFAHHVRIDFLSTPALKATTRLHALSAQAY